MPIESTPGSDRRAHALQHIVLGEVLPGGTRSLSGPHGQCVGSGMGLKRSRNLPRVPQKLS
jgi:hypothetical protein